MCLHHSIDHRQAEADPFSMFFCRKVWIQYSLFSFCIDSRSGMGHGDDAYRS